MPRRSVVGRGASGNLKNRFESSEIEPNPILPDEEPRPETVYLKDHSHSIIARNDSPDIGFDASINPYRGCSHGCVYCVSGDTPILMANGTTRRLEDLRVGEEIYGTLRRGAYRCYTKTRVLVHWSVYKAAYRVTLRDGTSLVSSGDHRFLTERGWKFVIGAMCGDGQRPYLTTNDRLMGTGAFAPPPAKDRDYSIGYLCGLMRGDGHLGTFRYRRARGAYGDAHRFRLADKEALERASCYLLELGVATQSFVFKEALGGRKGMQAIRTSTRKDIGHVGEIIAWLSNPPDSWCKGFLAGIVDVQGNYGGGILRISNTDPTIVECTTDCLKRLSFDFTIENVSKDWTRPIVVRIRGGLKERLRFFHTVGTAITRKRNIESQAVNSGANLRVASIEPLGVMPLFDITAGTGDFIADGVVSHNCYARPTHEYLGLSAGLNFESRILVKEDAPELLHKELSSPRWEPRALSMSGVTDPYQPVERRLRSPGAASRFSRGSETRSPSSPRTTSSRGT